MEMIVWQRRRRKARGMDEWVSVEVNRICEDAKGVTSGELLVGDRVREMAVKQKRL